MMSLCEEASQALSLGDLLTPLLPSNQLTERSEPSSHEQVYLLP